MWQYIGCLLVTIGITVKDVLAFPVPEGDVRPLNIQLPNQQGYPVNNQMQQQMLQSPTGKQYQNGPDHPNMVSASKSYDSYASYGNANSYDSGYGGGEENYNYGFDCYGKKPAFYGDGNYDCKVYHVCQADGRSDTFKCPKWTRFNNYLGICDWHFKVDNYCNPLYKENPYGSEGQQSY